MTETPAAETAPQEPSPDAPPPAVPEAAQPEQDWKAMARTWEKRAKENADAAKRLADIENANKTEAQKNLEALEAARQEAATATAQLARYEVAADKGVPPSLIRFITGSTRDEIEESAAALLDAIPGAPGSPPRAPAEAARTIPNGAPSSQPFDANAWMRQVGAP